MKYTKGPWRALRHGGSAASGIVSEVETVTIAYTYSNGDAIANARLIAAAPELLEALDDLLADIQDDGKATQASINKARAIINRAKGE